MPWTTRRGAVSTASVRPPSVVLGHPNRVSVFDSGISETEHLCIAIEHMPERSLANHTAPSRPASLAPTVATSSTGSGTGVIYVGSAHPDATRALYWNPGAIRVPYQDTDPSRASASGAVYIRYRGA